jgi:hypothetical protein
LAGASSIRISYSAERDLAYGVRFYDGQEPGLGTYFLDSLTADIDSLQIFAGVYPKPLADFHRALARRFPYAIYYDFVGETAYVAAVLDCRQKPAAIRSKLAARRKIEDAT